MILIWILASKCTLVKPNLTFLIQFSYFILFIFLIYI